MSKKKLLFLGIILLTTGILFRVFTDWFYVGISLIIAGALCKSIYLYQRVKTGNYKPGIELVCLIIGLLIFFTGLYLKTLETGLNPMLFIFTGILLKLTFIVLFIKKLKTNN